MKLDFERFFEKRVDFFFVIEQALLQISFEERQFTFGTLLEVEPQIFFAALTTTIRPTESEYARSCTLALMLRPAPRRSLDNPLHSG